MKLTIFHIGVVLSHLSCFCVLFYTFLRAYLNDYQIKIFINTYGEAHVEFVMFTLLLIFEIIFAIDITRNYISEKKLRMIK